MTGDISPKAINNSASEEMTGHITHKKLLKFIDDSNVSQLKALRHFSEADVGCSVFRSVWEL